MPDIAYALIRSRRKTVSIAVGRDAGVVVRAPLRMGKAVIERFVRSKRNWILEKQAEARRRAALHRASEPANGEEFPYLGRRLMLAVSDSASRIEAVGFTLAFPRPWLPRAQVVLRQWYAERAGAVVTERVGEWTKRTGIRASSVGVTGARRRWGSCSAKGALNFAWRLVMAPPDVIDYVVVHELVHIEHLNHSKEFWARVGEIMPDYVDKKRWLKENGALLSLF